MLINSNEISLATILVAKLCLNTREPIYFPGGHIPVRRASFFQQVIHISAGAVLSKRRFDGQKQIL